MLCHRSVFPGLSQLTQTLMYRNFSFEEAIYAVEIYSVMSWWSIDFQMWHRFALMLHISSNIFIYNTNVFLPRCRPSCNKLKLKLCFLFIWLIRILLPAFASLYKFTSARGHGGFLHLDNNESVSQIIPVAYYPVLSYNSIVFLCSSPCQSTVHCLN